LHTLGGSQADNGSGTTKKLVLLTTAQNLSGEEGALSNVMSAMTICTELLVACSRVELGSTKFTPDNSRI
jgi:hypothetical protein